MSDFDPVRLDLNRLTCTCCSVPTVDSIDVPQLVANELRRQYDEHGDPGLYFLILRAQILEQL